MMPTESQYDLSLPRALRRANGAYYTPAPLIDLLLDHGLEPLLDRTSDLGQLRIADPACGDGRFLLAAAQRIERRGVPLGEVIRHCVFGVDTDPNAIRTSRTILADAAGCSSRDLRQIHRGDGLTAWSGFRFDAVLGNPPFRNAIEGEVARQPRHPLIGGTADLAYRFLVRATELVRPGGVVAYIQPRPVLNAACLARFRAGLPGGLRPNLIFAPDRSRLFPGALVFTCALVLGPNKMCRVSRDPEARSESWAEGPITSTNWWRSLNLLLNESSDRAEAGARLGDRFEVWAGMTAGEAYDLRPFVCESSRAARGRLVTTGLIDPGVCHWGKRRCRYLGEDFQHPAVKLSRFLPPTLRRRLARSRRPKIIVAGLSRRLECVLDEKGRLLGAVSTFAILDPNDDVRALRQLADWLHGPDIDERFRHDLGANAVGGGDTVMTKAFLKSLPLPAEWDETVQRAANSCQSAE
jgi:SAM-dependent methyltransferase